MLGGARMMVNTPSGSAVHQASHDPLIVGITNGTGLRPTAAPTLRAPPQGKGLGGVRRGAVRSGGYVHFPFIKW